MGDVHFCYPGGLSKAQGFNEAEHFLAVQYVYMDVVGPEN